MGKIVKGIFTSFNNFRVIPILRYILRIDIEYSLHQKNDLILILVCR